METMGFQGLMSGLPRTYWLLWAGLLVNRVGTMVVPMLTAYLTKVRGLSLAQAGTTVAAFGGGALFGNLVGGSLADAYGRRGTMLLSLTCGAVAMLGLGHAEAPLALIGWAFTLGLFGEMFRPAAQAVVADVVPPELRMKAFTLQYWAVNLGFAIAALVGGALATDHFDWLFWGDAGTTLLFAGLVAVALPETRPTSRPAEQSQGSVLTPFADRAFMPMLVLCFLCALVVMQCQVAMQADMLAKGLDTAQYGKAMALNGVLIVCFQPLMSKLVEGRDRQRVLAAAALLTGLGLGSLAFAHSLYAVMGTVAIWTVGEMLMAPVNAAVVADAAPSHLRGRYQAALSLCWALAFSAAPVVGTRVAEAAGFGWLWAGCAAVGVLTALGYWLRAGRGAATQAASEESLVEPASS